MQEIQGVSEKAQEHGMKEILKVLRGYKQEPMDLRSLLRGCDDKRKTSQILVDVARKTGKELYYALDKWLDFLLDVFNSSRYIDNTFETNIHKVREECPEFYNLMHRWVNTVYSQKEEGVCTDFFGSIYEENFQSSHKASQLGQFFTPTSLSKMLGELVFEGKKDKCSIMDCACGSGRLLLGYAEKEGFQRTTLYVAGDVDTQSVKMCALNLMVHGLQGVVLQQDALMLDEPKDIFVINEVDYPVETGMRSVTRLTTDEALRIGLLNKNGEQYSLSDAYTSRHCNLLTLVEGKGVEAEYKPNKREPIQLTLFD